MEEGGKAQFNEEQLARVRGPVTGGVVEVLARPGDLVESGQRLFVLDSPDLGQAKSDYAKAAADVERAQKALDLARELFEARAIAQKEIRETENDWRKAIAERERAASRLRTLGVPPAQLDAVAGRPDAANRTVAAAPRRGIIVERNVAPRQGVAYRQSGTPLTPLLFA